MIEFDPNHGLVKFKSDLLFEKGSDQVTTAADDAIKALCGILNSEQAKEFHIIVAGHTDDIPIKKAQTRDAAPLELVPVLAPGDFRPELAAEAAASLLSG